jgi:hypothetical protein
MDLLRDYAIVKFSRFLIKTIFQGKSNTDPRMREIRRPSSTDDRPKSHSPSTKDPSTTNSDPRKKFDSTERKKFESSKLVDSFDRHSSKLVDSFDGKSPENCCSSKTGSWSSADSVQHYPERDTSGQVRTHIKGLNVNIKAQHFFYWLPFPNPEIFKLFNKSKG